MFLATTANPEWWDENQPLLFIASWCLRQDRKAHWENRRYKVLPNPWNDPARTAVARKYIETVVEKLLHLLADYLNTVHQIDASPRYWRILIGPWLEVCTKITYDRYVQIKEAINLCSALDSVLLPKDVLVTSKDTSDFHQSLKSDLFNLQIATQVLHCLGYSFPTVKVASIDDQRRPTRAPCHRVPAVPFLRDSVAPLVMLHEMYCSDEISHKIIRALHSRACSFPCAARNFSNLPEPVFDSDRLQLGSLPADDEFERIVVAALPTNFPTLWLEAFQAARTAMQHASRDFASVIVSANAWHDNEIFKFYAAEAAEIGGRIVSVQHGGGYGVYEHSPDEVCEKSISDSFVAWGWDDAKYAGQRIAPSLQLVALRRELDEVNAKRPTGTAASRITYFGTDCPPWWNRFRNQPVFDQWDSYFQWQVRFLISLHPKLQHEVTYRPYMHDYGRNTTGLLREKVPLATIDSTSSWRSTLPHRLAESRLAVVDHNATTFLLALGANIPTVAFWDSSIWRVRSEAQPYFSELRQVGILWDTPESAAAHVESVYEDVHRWWGSGPTQQARARFAERYALWREDWLGCWRDLLLDELHLSQSTGVSVRNSVESRDGNRACSEVLKWPQGNETTNTAEGSILEALSRLSRRL